jgi:hypothetical protein
MRFFEQRLTVLSDRQSTKWTSKNARSFLVRYETNARRVQLLNLFFSATTIGTNLIKFPFFEVTNMIMNT